MLQIENQGYINKGSTVLGIKGFMGLCKPSAHLLVSRMRNVKGYKSLKQCHLYPQVSLAGISSCGSILNLSPPKNQS